MAVFKGSIPMRDIQGYFTEQQIKKIFDSVKNTRDLLIIRLLYKCGRRVSEVLAVKKSDISWEEKKIVFQILKKKTKEFAQIPVDETTLTLLKDYCANKKDNEFLFPITRQCVFKMVRSVCHQAGIYKIGNKEPHPHHFRHSLAVHWMKKGGDFTRLFRLLGHTDIKTTQFYLKFNPQDIDEEYRKVMDNGL